MLPRLLIGVALVAAYLALPLRTAMADGLSISPEIDPLPFALGGYGTQLGIRDERIASVRVAPASFSLDVPDAVAELGGNEGFHIRVRPSAAVYVLYLPSGTGKGWAIGGALRYLRLRITHDDDAAARADVGELSPEVIGGYRWFPTSYGFYAQPWAGVSFTAYRRGDLGVGARTYDPMPVQLFFTVNLGWELAL